MQDRIARALITAGWANESFGSVEDVGHISLLTVDSHEALEVARVAEESIGEAGSPTIVGPDVMGNFIVREDSQGLTWVATFPTAAAAKQQYDDLERAYLDLQGSEEDEG